MSELTGEETAPPFPVKEEGETTRLKALAGAMCARSALTVCVACGTWPASG